MWNFFSPFSIIKRDYSYFVIVSCWAYFFFMLVCNLLFNIHTHILSSQLMNQSSRTTYNSSSAHLFNEHNFQLIWFMNQVQRVNCRVEFRTIFELVRFIVSLTSFFESPNIIKQGSRKKC